MKELPERIHDEGNSIGYVLAGDYYIPDLKLSEEKRQIGHWGRMHWAYLEECHHTQYISLLLTGKFWTYLADLDEQADDRMDVLTRQMMEAGGVTEELKASDQMEWVRLCNSIRSRAEEIVRCEIIYI